MDRLDELDPIHVGQCRLAEDEVNRVRGQRPQGRRAVPGADHAVPGGLEMAAQVTFTLRVVFCHQHGSRGIAGRAHL